MADFLLDWEYASKWVFCASGHDECVYQILSFIVQVGGGASQKGGATEPAGHDLAPWQHRSFQGDSLCIPERFGRDRKLYEEVMRTWCFTAKDLNWPLHCGQQVWRRIKILITFHLQSQRMILSDCEATGVTSVGGDNFSTKIGNISKWRPHSKWPT